MEKEKSLNESIISIRVKLQNTKIKKSGKNRAIKNISVKAMHMSPNS